MASRFLAPEIENALTTARQAWADYAAHRTHATPPSIDGELLEAERLAIIEDEYHHDLMFGPRD